VDSWSKAVSDNVVQLPKLIAWAPVPKGLGLRLSAILVKPDQHITRNLYLSFLGERIQALVNACPDPRAATIGLQKDLWDAGLYPDLGFIPTQEAGSSLVATNPGTRERLDSWGALPSGNPAPEEMPRAREALNEEKSDPLGSLHLWAALLRRLP